MTVSVIDIKNNANQEKKKDVPFEEAITMAGFGWYNIRILLVSGLCLMSCIVETTQTMFIVPAAQCDLGLTLSLKGILGAVGYAGIIFSSHLWGYLADTRGRRYVLIISLVVSAITSFLCTIVPWAWLYITIRFINGFFIGGTSSVVYAFNGEYQSNHYRPKVISWMASFVAITNIFLPSTAWLILPQEWSYYLPIFNFYFRPWRLLCILYSIPSIMGAFLVYLLPETPKFLLTQERHDEALDILKNMYALNKGKSPEDYPVETVYWEQAIIDEGDKKKISLLRNVWNQTVPLFKRPMLLKTLLVCFVQYGAFFSGAGVVMWYPEILNKLSQYEILHPDEDVGLCKAYESNNGFLSTNITLSADEILCEDTIRTDVFLAVIIQGAIFTVLYLTIGTIINYVGKKNIIYLFIVTSTTCGIVAQFVYGKTLIQILIIIFLIGGVGIGINNTIVVDIYPTQVRAMALSISLLFGRLGAITSTNIVGPVIHHYCDYLFFCFAFINAMSIVALILLPSQAYDARKSKISLK